MLERKEISRGCMHAAAAVVVVVVVVMVVFRLTLVDARGNLGYEFELRRQLL